MGSLMWGAAAAAATTVGWALRRRRGNPSALAAAQDPDRWRVVTVHRPPGEVPAVPDALAALGEAVQVRTRPAPGGRGTEIAVRLMDPDAAVFAGQDAVRVTRTALREAKQVLEVGWVLTPDEHAEGERTLLNAPLRAATHRSWGEGRL